MNNVLRNGIEKKYIKSFNSINKIQSHGNCKIRGISPLFPAGIIHFSGVNIKCGFTPKNKKFF
jgi:hypothetical protein